MELGDFQNGIKRFFLLYSYPRKISVGNSNLSSKQVAEIDIYIRDFLSRML